MRFCDGGILEGNWQKGRFWGSAALTRTNGDIFKGGWDSSFRGDGQISVGFHAQWVLTWENGDEYEGGLESSKKMRWFRVQENNRDTYLGDIETESLHKQRKRKMLLHNGDECDQDQYNSVHERQWKNGKMNEKGINIFANRGMEAGEWKDGEKVWNKNWYKNKKLLKLGLAFRKAKSKNYLVLCWKKSLIFRNFFWPQLQHQSSRILQSSWKSDPFWPNYFYFEVVLWEHNFRKRFWLPLKFFVDPKN